MKKLLLASFLLMSFIGFGQCPTSPIILTSQAEVDAFAATYPGCTNLVADFTISGSDITNLSGLSQLVSSNSDVFINDNALLVTANELSLEVSATTQFVEIINNPLLANLPNLTQVGPSFNTLIVENNPSLLHLNGFLGLTAIEFIEIKECNGLINLAGLDNIDFYQVLNIKDNSALQSISELGNYSGDVQSLEINNNPQLANLHGLEGIVNTGIVQMSITNNDSLINLEGLDNLSSGIDFTISENDSLESFEGLNSATNFNMIYIANNPALVDISNIETIVVSQIFSLTITGNSSLSACSLLNICNYLGNNGTSTIENNASDCNSVTEVIDNCGEDFNYISGTITYDFNNDDCDNDDYPAQSMLVEIANPSQTVSTVTNSLGEYDLYVYHEGIFVITIAPASIPDGFLVTPESQEFSLTGFGNSIIADFCLSALEVINDLKITMIPPNQARPGFNSEYKIVYENIGTTVLSGEVTLQFDDSRQVFLESIPMEDDISGNQLTWNYNDLLPFQSETITVSFNNLPPPTNNSGDILEFEAIIYPITDDVTPNNNSINFKQDLVNSYDPNDKQVVQGAEIFEETVGDYLDYIIRFQNTGTADAINVRVDDVLSENLDWNTFRMLSASHEYRVEITSGNEVSFIFDNINLPPEVSDPEGSNGFIAFQIRTDDTLEIGDSVNNTASIFFDFNAPIITNTVTTTVVEPLSVSESTLSNEVSIYPNPTSEILSINASEGVVVESAMVYSILGEQLVVSSEKNINVSTLSEGIYFITIKTNQGRITKKIVKE